MSIRIQYRAISYFDAVRRCGSIREAARQLNVAPSAVNRQILKFEAEFGMPLFERLQGGLRLTPAGEVMARHAIAVLHDERRAISELDALAGVRRGEVKILSVEALATTLLPTAIARMVGRNPGVTITVRIAGSNAIPAAVIAGDADIGLAFSMNQNRDLQQAGIGRFRLGAIMPPGHELARLKRLRLSDCIGYPVVLPTPELSIFDLLKPSLRRVQDRMSVIAEVNSLELMKQLTLRLGAIGFQSRLGIEDDLSTGRLAYVPFAQPGPATTDLGVYLRRGRAMPPALNAFMAILLDEVSARAADDQELC